MLLTDTEPADFCDGIEGCSSFHYLPFDIVGGVVPYERPDIFTEGGACVLLILSVYVSHVAIVPGLHWVVGGTSVCLPVAGVSPGDSCLVHQVVHLAANAWEDFACVRMLFRSTGTSESLGCCSIIVVVVVVVAI